MLSAVVLRTDVFTVRIHLKSPKTVVRYDVVLVFVLFHVIVTGTTGTVKIVRFDENLF